MSTIKSSVTPMMAQYLNIKEQHKDALLFYRMGDFYEMFFDDAVAAAEALDIALTKRGKHLGKDIPMCGVPVHAAESYLLTLIRKGFRVAVCEQMENPAEAKKRGSKSVVKREVVRLVTPGTLTEDSLLEARRHNFLAAYALVRDEGALAWADISTGAFHVAPCPLARLSPELARIAPQELLINTTHESEIAEITDDLGLSLTPLSAASFDSASAKKRLQSLFNVATLDAFGKFSRPEVAALGAIIDYLDITQKGNLPILRPPRREDTSRKMQIDTATRRNLELTEALSGGRDGSLISVIDQTITAQGARLLEQRLSGPSRDLGEIIARHDCVDYLLINAGHRDALREALKKVPDMDRALSRISMGRGGPRDMAAIRAALSHAKAIAREIDNDAPDLLRKSAKHLVGHEKIADLLKNALAEEPPLLARDGGFIAPGYDKELDEERRLASEGRGIIAEMQAQYARKTDISSLKIKHNNVLGYFVETTAKHADRMLSPPLSETFIHRQTTANAVRFTTVELSDLERRILNAGNSALEIEKRHYSALSDMIIANADAIGSAASALAEIDLHCAFAELAQTENWCRPKVDDSHAFEITAGRHPVVEVALRRQGANPFVSNDCYLSGKQQGAAIWLLTGPNMAGKSTFLRQNALMALLAQTGAFVPAQQAHIGLVSQLFSRVGAADDLARGRSTFMVEMVETAAILTQADDRALVILDEIGRGTATYDGLSIAWATLEHLHDVNACRALFATHYHEMTALADRLEGVSNATVAVKEWEGDVIFLHEVRKGAADRSYGVQVARLAGLPETVIDRARTVLEALEKGSREGTTPKAAIFDDLPLFCAQAARPEPQSRPTRLEKMLAEILPDELTPKQALALIYEMKELIRKPE